MSIFLTILIFSFSHLTRSFDLATYKSDYQAQVAVPYKTAVTVAASNIVEYLAITPVPKSYDAGKFVLATLNVQARALASNLGSASSASSEIIEMLNNEDYILLGNISKVESESNKTKNDIEAVNGQIQQEATAVQIAQNEVNAEQEQVKQAEDKVRQEEQAVDNAKNCMRGWGPGGAVGGLICSVVNYDNLNRYKRDRDNAYTVLRDRQNALAPMQQKLGQLQQDMANLKQTESQLEADQTRLMAQLDTLTLARLNVANIDEQLKKLTAHFETLFKESTHLIDVIKDLIDMETVIDPITTIADDIMAFTPNVADVTYLAAMKQKIALNLPLVQMKLPEYEMIIPPSD